ncbi:TolB family protein [Pseudooceanicola algae]|uniref:Translocation protein TolB n=1 Tax=Pseudooceanicola algae TaxID=1537215 RepID=A0A418SD71_9RHOB|nr:hypothetical protein [Pseudooceanicola algae]QPM92550.1 hypothetical protein PSAL_038140 [Pseudooceanicola algae]
MKTDNLISTLKAAKRNAKMVPELARVSYGAATRKFISEGRPLPIGTAIPAPPRPYRPESSRVPVQVMTPAGGHYMTTFFDIDPVSPSGRYLAVTKVPFIWRIPYVGDPAQVVVIDLLEGTATPIYTTRGWGAQLGANVQWGADDDTLYCNDVIEGRATGVALERSTGKARVLGGPIYGLSPDRKISLSGRIDYVNAGIPGYGVPEGLLHRPRQPHAENPEDGIWRTDLETGKSELFLSIADIVSALPGQEGLKGGTYYVFNVKVNAQGTRGFAVLFTRKIPGRPGWPPQLVTFDMDGSNIRLAMSDARWRIGGHHPSWLPDGDHIIMNLRDKKQPMAFVKFRYDGENIETLAPGQKGGGHPTLNPQLTHLLTDAYTSERDFVDDAGDVPIRCIDLASAEDQPLTRVNTRKLDGPRRIDPHPVWTDQGRKVIFNGIIDGYRQVLMADTSGLAEG